MLQNHPDLTSALLHCALPIARRDGGAAITDDARSQLAVSRSLGALCWKEFIPDVARRWRQTNATRLAPCRFVDFLFVADCQATGRFRRDEDRVTHFPARTTVLGLNFLPKPNPSKFEFRKFFFDLPAQAIFIAFSRSLAPLRGTSKVRRAFVLRAAPVRVSRPPVSRISPFR